jgi:cytoskeletal protein CcmA (bactofilin family)
MDTPKPPDAARGEIANIGKSVIIKGELSGSEDLYIDGQIDGAIEMKGNRLTIGPNGRVKANVNARSAVIQGKLEGNVRATDRVDLKQSAIVLGDIATQRISIEEGAYFKGGVDIQREAGKIEAKTEPKPSSVVAASATPAPSASAQTAGAEPRK